MEAERKVLQYDPDACDHGGPALYRPSHRTTGTLDDQAEFESTGCDGLPRRDKTTVRVADFVARPEDAAVAIDPLATAERPGPWRRLVSWFLRLFERGDAHV